jgi:hypothetical protein
MRLLARLIESRWFQERILGRHFISPERAHHLYCRQEMDRHPWQRTEPWRGMETPHRPVWVHVHWFDLATRPLVRRRRIA